MVSNSDENEPVPHSIIAQAQAAIVGNAAGDSSRSHARRPDTHGVNQASSSNNHHDSDSAVPEILEPPPSYGGNDVDEVQISQDGFTTKAKLTDDGRVNININSTTRKLSDLLVPALRSQLSLVENEKQHPLPPGYIPLALGGHPGQTPPPPLNVVIHVVGSRGDVQPFVALGKTLKSTYGHRVRLATHPTFQTFVEENGLEFFSIGGDPAELMAFMVKNPGLMPGIDSLKSGDVGKRRKGMEEIVMGCWRSCIEPGNGLGAPVRTDVGKPQSTFDAEINTDADPAEKPFIADAIIANPPSFAHVHIAEKLGIPLHLMFTMPWSPTQSFPHPLANIQSSNLEVSMTNFITYALVEMMTWQGLGDIINRFRSNTLGLDPISLIWGPAILTRLRVPYTYCWSPALIPKPKDWGQHISVSGFYFLSLASSFTPDPELAAFLKAGPPPVYIGFGSIVVDDPNAMTNLIFEAVKKTGIRALVSKGWGGLGADELGVPEGVYMLGNVPHDWLFKHVSCVVHHGGAGTTAAGIALGRPTVVVPFFGDQPFWGNMIARAGAGPPPIPYKSLTAEKLAEAILEALKPSSLERAQELGEKIREEKGTEVGGKAFHDHLNVHNLRCSLAPSRAAVWQVKRTEVRLSALAATVLANEGLLSFSDLKLYRAKEYDAEDGPWDPISGGASALVGTIASLSMGVADLPLEIFKSLKKVGANPDDAKSRQSSSPSAGPSIAEGKQDQITNELDIHQRPELLSTSSSASIASRSDDGSYADSTPRAGTPGTPATSMSSPPPSVKGEGKEPIIGGKEANPNKFTFEHAMSTGKGMSRIVGAGMKSPMDFTMGLARGFHNAPKLYGDDTVRPQAKVTDFQSGLAAAGKEFTYGFYDGITGLITQPLRGAEKEGAAGLLKGIGRGIGGLVLKPGAAIWGLPGYTMMGIHKEIKGIFGASVSNYIISARTAQGYEDWKAAGEGERQDIVARWKVNKVPLPKQKKNSKESSDGKARNRSTSPRGFFQTRHLSFDERKRLQDERKARAAAGPVTANIVPERSTPVSNDSEGSRVDPQTTADFEEAIRASVATTSRGNTQEDAIIERAIRASVRELQRSGVGITEQQALDRAIQASIAETTTRSARADHSTTHDVEYEARLQRALQDSLHPATSHSSHSPRNEEEGGEVRMVDNDIDTDDDEEVKTAMEASRLAHEQKTAARTEEEIVLEYVKKQSLLEAEHKKKATGSVGQATQSSSSTMGEDEDDEDLKRAIEESMKG